MSLLSKAGALGGAAERLNQIVLHINPYSKQITIDFEDLPSQTDANKPVQKIGANEGQAELQAKLQAEEAPKQKKFSIPKTEFTAEEVAKHNREDDCWVIVKNVVMNLTSFLDNHPGGRGSILKFAGQDATESFAMLHEDNVVPRYAPECVMGILKGAEPKLEI